MTQSRITEIKRRLSREQGTIFKDWGGKLPIALIYPNSYYVGMSNLGIHTIYNLLNSYPDVVCERVFWEQKGLSQSMSPVSLESQRPLSDFTVLAFSVSYELDYFNVVSILKTSGIPLYAADRDQEHPLVIAGGPCITANPMPLSPFFDCLCIGEAESILPAMLSTLSRGIRDKRSELLAALAILAGIYVPPAQYRQPILRQWLKNLDEYPAHSVILTPDTELGKLYLIEVERGCNWGCRFCLVANAFSPMRFRSIEKLLAQVEQRLDYGKRIGLVGPAVSDHPRFEELVNRLQSMGAQVSFSSLRIKSLSTGVLKAIALSRTQAIALAPEAGSQRLRDVIKKGITEDDILKSAEMIGREHLKQLKLYFMIGLPSETDDDIKAIVALTLKCKAILDRQQTGCRLILSIAPFIPKAGTPFQWLTMTDLPTLNQRLSILKNSLSPKGISIKSESPAWSHIQAVLARGDKEIAEALANIEKVSLAGWHGAIRQCQVDTDYYLHQNWDTGKPLPWSIIESGNKTSYPNTE